MTRYTLGLIFNTSMDKILLIQKMHPRWQKGKLNGIGGKIEKGESAISCMVRETKEECDLIIGKEDWRYIGNFSSPDWNVKIYTTIYKGKITDAKSMEEEKIQWLSTKLSTRVLSNLFWLVPLSLECLKNPHIKSFTIKY